MIGIASAFSQSYARARTQFLEAAAAAGLLVESHTHPLKGRDGETLAMDVVRDGPDNAQHLLIVTSACHGVEGYCGSGVQVFALHDEAWRAKAREQGVAVLYIHGLNPYGFSHIRRATHENVDLNRNFHDFTQPLPVNPAYREIQPLLLPDQWPPTAENRAAVFRFIGERGEAAWQAAISRGQHEFPGAVLRRHGAHMEQPHAAPGAARAGRTCPAHRLDRPAHGPGAQRPRRTHLRGARRCGLGAAGARLVGGRRRHAGHVDL